MEGKLKIAQQRNRRQKERNELMAKELKNSWEKGGILEHSFSKINNESSFQIKPIKTSHLMKDDSSIKQLKNHHSSMVSVV